LSPRSPTLMAISFLMIPPSPMDRKNQYPLGRFPIVDHPRQVAVLLGLSRNAGNDCFAVHGPTSSMNKRIEPRYCSAPICRTAVSGCYDADTFICAGIASAKATATPGTVVASAPVRRKANLGPSSKDLVRELPPSVRDRISDIQSTAIRSRHDWGLAAPASFAFCTWDKADDQSARQNARYESA
jgi:hypothetical protein